jgi:hypothetical protein
MEIKPAYVTFEQAKILVEKGANLSTSYNEHCDEKEYYHKQTGEVKLYSYFNVFENMIPIPQQWQVVEWLRVKHGVHIIILPDNEEDFYDTQRVIYHLSIKTVHKGLHNLFTELIRDGGILAVYKSPQEAYSAAFDYVFKNLI